MSTEPSELRIRIRELTSDGRTRRTADVVREVGSVIPAGVAVRAARRRRAAKRRSENHPETRDLDVDRDARTRGVIPVERDLRTGINYMVRGVLHSMAASGEITRCGPGLWVGQPADVENSEQG